MNYLEKMSSSAFLALNELFNTSSMDKVLILSDIHCKAVAEAFSNACSKIDCEVETFEVNEQDRPLKEPPE
jgi:hypothetical protein